LARSGSGTKQTNTKNSEGAKCVPGTGEWWERSVGGLDRRKVATEADVWREMRRGRPSGRRLVGRVTGGGGGGEVAGAAVAVVAGVVAVGSGLVVAGWLAVGGRFASAAAVAVVVRAEEAEVVLRFAGYL
jgi:hypothetical protein